MYIGEFVVVVVAGAVTSEAKLGAEVGVVGVGAVGVVVEPL